MEPQTIHEDEKISSDIETTPENVKTSKFSKDYKQIIKLLYKFCSVSNTEKLLSNCLKSKILPKSFRINPKSPILMNNFNVEDIETFEHDAN